MKLLLITNMYPSRENPAYGIFVKNFQLMFEKNGIEFSHIIKLNFFKKNNFLKLLHYIKFYLEIIYHTLVGNFDAIYIHNASHTLIPLILIKPFINKPLFINAHGTDIIENKYINRFSKKILPMLIENNPKNHLVVPSRFLKNTALSQIPIKDHRIIVSPSSGINPDVFHPKIEMHQLIKKLREEKKYLIGYYSRMSKSKGCFDFVESFKVISKKIPSAVAIMLGDGPEMKEIQKQVNENSLENRIIIIGKVDQKIAASYLVGLDILVFPSHLPESLGLVALEALACGTPVIAYNTGAVPEYIQNAVNGYLVNKEAIDQLSSNILFHYSLTNATKESMRQAAHFRSLDFKTDSISNLLINDLRQILKFNN